MTIPSGAVKDFEKSKFRPGDTVGEVKLGVLIEQPASQPIPISASFGLPSGLDYYDEFGQQTAVASGIETTIISRTVLATYLYLGEVKVSGSNFALFKVYVNGVVKDLIRTNYFAPLHYSFNFNSFKLLTNDIVHVTCLHDSPETGDFEARLIGVVET